MRRLKLDELNRPSIEDYKEQQKHAITLVLDDIRSAHNVGAAFRTADAMGVEQIYLCGITAQPPHREITKTAIGATKSVAWKHYTDVASALTVLRDAGYLIVALEQTDESMALQTHTLTSDTPIAIVVGNEVSGVSDAALSLADLALEIPQRGTKHSLNVSVSLGMALWELVRTRL